MKESDVALLVSWFLSAFGIGFTLGFILRLFRRTAGLVR